MFENVDGRRTDDGRTTDDGVTGILIAHLGAFGSGELKMTTVFGIDCFLELLPEKPQLRFFCQRLIVMMLLDDRSY